MPDGEERVVICRAGGERFALPISAVRQVVAVPALTRIPGAPAAVAGVANVHGSLVTALRASELLGLSGAGPSGWLLVLSLHDGRVGLEVDEVEDVGHPGNGLPLVDLEALIRPLLPGSGGR